MRMSHWWIVLAILAILALAAIPFAATAVTSGGGTPVACSGSGNGGGCST
jgi:hypothetical protein